MSELAKCRLCGGEADPFGNDIYTCDNGDCVLSCVFLNKEEWQKLNAPDPRVAELESQIERLELDLHLERQRVEELSKSKFDAGAIVTIKKIVEHIAEMQPQLGVDPTSIVGNVQAKYNYQRQAEMLLEFINGDLLGL